MPGRMDEAASGEAIVIGDFAGEEAGDRQGAGFGRGFELRFGEQQACEFAFEDIDAEGRHAVASLGERLRREPRQQAILVCGEVHGGDEALLRSARARRKFLSELEHGRGCPVSLPAQAQRSAADVTVHDSPDPHYLFASGKAVEKEAAFAFDAGVAMWWLHLSIFDVSLRHCF